MYARAHTGSGQRARQASQPSEWSCIWIALCTVAGWFAWIWRQGLAPIRSHCSRRWKASAREWKQLRLWLWQRRAAARRGCAWADRRPCKCHRTWRTWRLAGRLGTGPRRSWRSRIFCHASCNRPFLLWLPLLCLKVFRVHTRAWETQWSLFSRQKTTLFFQEIFFYK